MKSEEKNEVRSDEECSLDWRSVKAIVRKNDIAREESAGRRGEE